MLDHPAEIAGAHPHPPSVMSDRSVQIWEPMVIIGDLAGGDWPELARQAAVGLSGSAEANDPVGALLFGIWFLFSSTGGVRMFTRTLVESLNSMTDRSWGGMRHGKGITDAWLADQLQPHGIAPRTMRIGSMQAKGYFEEDFQEAFQRYMSRSEIEALQSQFQAQWEKPGGGGKSEWEI